jgi:hypothetical protein
MEGLPLAPPELKEVHPLGKSPVITDGDTTIAESGAIVEYIIDTYGGGRMKPPAGSDDYWKYIEWMHYAEGSAMLPLLMALYSTFLGDAAAILQPRVDSEIANNLSYVERGLEGASFRRQRFERCRHSDATSGSRGSALRRLPCPRWHTASAGHMPARPTSAASGRAALPAHEPLVRSQGAVSEQSGGGAAPRHLGSQRGGIWDVRLGAPPRGRPPKSFTPPAPAQRRERRIQPMLSVFGVIPLLLSRRVVPGTWRGRKRPPR